jgi:3-phytase
VRGDLNHQLQCIRRLVVIASVAFLVAACAEGGELVGRGERGAGAHEVTLRGLARDASAVTAALETESVRGDGDVADDPAIWVHPSDPGSSLVIGTNKDESTGGLHVYGLDGKERQYLPAGEMNNVDLRYGFDLGGAKVDLVGASNRTRDTIDFFKISPTTGRLEAVGSASAGIRVYGFCMYRSPFSGSIHAFVNSKQGEVEQYALQASDGVVTATRVRSFEVGDSTEGCVADDELGHLYVGEEQRGVWRYDAEPDSGTTRALVDESGSGRIRAEIEGVSLYYEDGGGYLIVSSQGSDTFAVYERGGDNKFLGTFKVVEDNGFDRVSETDGIDVTSATLGSSFPQGLLVVHDHNNADAPTSNFKFVDWDEIVRAIGL